MKEPAYAEYVKRFWPSHWDLVKGRKCQGCDRHAEFYSISPQTGEQTFWCRVMCQKAFTLAHEGCDAQKSSNGKP